MQRRIYLLAGCSCSSPHPCPHLPPSLPPSTAWCTILNTGPCRGPKITLQAADSAFVMQATANADGEFELPRAPIGVYRMTVAADGLRPRHADAECSLGHQPRVAHSACRWRQQRRSVLVHGAPSAADTVTPTTLITRQLIDETPGADRTNGAEMITDYIPGAYMTHDMLHMRGGHQTSWLIDGVAIPNTKIASNVGPQIDPKDIDSLETQRGSYDADLGDRTYGMFNVLPRNGFEFNRDGDLLLYAGNLYTGEAQISFGDHTEKTAWYASATGSRSNYGLAMPVVAAIYHDATNSESGFVSLIHNRTPKDQLRVDAQMRQDFFRGPLRPQPEPTTNAPPATTAPGACATGKQSVIRSRLRIGCTRISPKALVSVAPFYHFNQADYDSRPSDTPAATTWHQLSNYAGAPGRRAHST